MVQVKEAYKTQIGVKNKKHFIWNQVLLYAAKMDSGNKKAKNYSPQTKTSTAN